MSKHNPTIRERLVVLEVLIKNHLKAHGKAEKYLLFPILVGVAILLVKAFLK